MKLDAPEAAGWAAAYLLLGELDLVQLLHVLLIVLLLQLADQDLLLLAVARVLLGGVLLELHGRLRVQSRHYLLPGNSRKYSPVWPRGIGHGKIKCPCYLFL